MYEREVAFYTDFADIAGMRVPSCYYAAVDEAERRFCIVLERLRDGEPGDNDRGGTREQLMRAADALAPMHAAWWTEQGFEQPWMMQFGRANRRMREMLPEAVRAFEELYGSLVPGPLQELVRTLPERMEEQEERRSVRPDIPTRRLLSEEPVLSRFAVRKRRGIRLGPHRGRTSVARPR